MVVFLIALNVDECQDLASLPVGSALTFFFLLSGHQRGQFGQYMNYKNNELKTIDSINHDETFV